MKILVKSIEKSFTRDDYELGEDPASTEYTDIDFVGWKFDTLEDLANELGLTTDKENWCVFDEGRIQCSVMENAHECEPSAEEMEQFSNGEIDLYAALYDIQIAFIEIHTPSEEEIAEKFKIRIY